MKGLAELEYSFKKKKEYANEFPIHSLKLRYESDVNQYGQNYLYTSKDNVFLALKREKDDRIGYFRQAELTYTNEFYSGFSFQLTARRRTDESSYLIPFLRKEGDVLTPVKEYSTSCRKGSAGKRLHLQPYRSGSAEAFLVLRLRLYGRHTESRKSMGQSAFPVADNA